MPGFFRFNGQSVARLGVVPAYAGARLPSGEVWFGGSFQEASGIPSPNLVRYVSPCPARELPYGVGCTGSGGTNRLSALTLPWIGTMFRAEATGMPGSGIAVSVLGVTQTAVPLNALLRQALPGCDLLATLDVLQGTTPRLGRAQTNLSLPPLTSLVGSVLHHQVIALETNASNALIAATATNGLRLAIGMF